MVQDPFSMHGWNAWLIDQFYIQIIAQCICSISHNVPFRTEMCTFLFWMVHCGIGSRCIVWFRSVGDDLAQHSVFSPCLKTGSTTDRWWVQIRAQHVSRTLHPFTSGPNLVQHYTKYQQFPQYQYNFICYINILNKFRSLLTQKYICVGWLHDFLFR